MVLLVYTKLSQVYIHTYTQLVHCLKGIGKGIGLEKKRRRQPPKFTDEGIAVWPSEKRKICILLQSSIVFP